MHAGPPAPSVLPMPRFPLTVAASLAAALSLPAAAEAAATIGVSPDAALPTAQLYGCAPAPSCTIGQERLSNEEFRVPAVDGAARGVVVRWRLYGQGGQARLRRVGGGATAATALPVTPGAQEQQAQLAVQQGDRLAVELLDGAQLSGEPSLLGGDLVHAWTPALGDGETRAPSGTTDAWLFYQAVIEPDRDGDGLGDETQDSCVACERDRTPGERPPGDGGPKIPDERTPDTPDPYAAVRRSGPRVTIAAKATATKAGVASVTLTNPYAFKLTGTIRLSQGRRAAGSARVTLASGASATTTVKLAAPTRKALASKRSLKLAVAVTARAAAGKARTTSRTVTVRLGVARRPATRRPGTGTPRGGPQSGVDGTYRASDGQTMVIAGGIVTSFNGDLTLHCTASGKQKRVTYGMIADDPNPKVAADGTFSWEATRGYGFKKLKFDGKVGGGKASGNLMIEDRSPLLGTGRIEFDYCFAGKQWTLTR